MSKLHRPHRHAFRFMAGGKVLTAWAKVRDAKEAVTLNLSAQDVRDSIEANGAGNSQTCSMAVCAKRQAGAFPHKVEGYIDWFYRTAFVVSRVDKNTGLPSECVAYDHRDPIALLNDSKGGQKALLTTLERDGSRKISLRPIAKRVRVVTGGSGNKNKGLRKKPPIPRGANLRYAVARLGGAKA